jgi:hypothetical protein
MLFIGRTLTFSFHIMFFVLPKYVSFIIIFSVL